MDTLNWNLEKLRFRNAMLDAWVTQSPDDELLDIEVKTIRSTLSKDTSLILRRLPSVIGEPVGYSLKGKPIYKPTSRGSELWKVKGLGSFDSIRFAKEFFGAPADKYFLEGGDSIEAIIVMLSKGFAEGEFKLSYVDEGVLLFDLTTANTTVTRKQYALLDKLNDRFFTGPHMEVADCCMPNFFLIGDAGTP